MSHNHASECATIQDLIFRRVEQSPEAIALQAPGRTPLTYRQLQERILHVADVLGSLGIQKTARVAVVLPNGPELAAAFVAVSAVAACAPLNPAYREAEFDFYLADLRAEALIVPAGVDSPARAVAKRRKILIVELAAPPGAAAGQFLLSTGEGCGTGDRTSAERPQRSDIALVLHTSGTTSRPKLVPLTQENICTSAFNIARTLCLTADDRCLNVMPLFHIHGLIGAILSSLAGGGSVICTSGFDADQFFMWLQHFNPTWYTAVPTIHEAVAARAARSPELTRGQHLRFIRSSSAALPPQVMHALEAAFAVPVIESYGMTEAAHQMCSNPLPPAARKAGTVGIAAGPEVMIMNEHGDLLAPGSVGEVVIRGANVTAGYENNSAANQQAFTNGWFRTGDQGRMDADGYLTITGRLKEIINRGGEKIAPREVEEVLLDHPAIAQCVAFAVPHPTLGEDLAAAVVLRQNYTANSQEFRDFAFGRLADCKVPSQVVIVDALPKGPTGKVQRIGVHEKLAAVLRGAPTPPADSVQEALAQIWSEVLQRQDIGIHDNFFFLGGDSLSATRVASRIRAAFDVAVPLKTIFRAPTIAGLAVVIEEMVLTEVEATL